MFKFIDKIYAGKKEYKRQMAHISALPDDYQFVYKKIAGYIWSLAGGTGTDMLKTQYDLIDLFESGAASGRHVLDVTGNDVSAFCDELIQTNKLWTDNIRRRLNRKINKKLS